MKKIVLLFLFVCSNAFSAITDGKFGINQIFDVQYWWNGNTLNASNFIAPYNKNFQTVTVSAGQYFQFFPSTTNPGKYGLKLMNSNGTQHSIVHDHGDITALGNGAIFYIGSGFFGNVITTATGYNYGASATFTNMDTSVTSADLNNYTFASSTPLAAGQTAAPAGPPPPAPTAIYMNNATVNIIRAIPTSNNSPGGEGPNNAFDNNPNTKYLNFDKKNAGVTVQLNTGRIVTGFTVTTANDFSGRDPTSYKLYGSNDGSTWTLIKQDSITLSENRFATSSVVNTGNTTAYAYYFMLFPTTKAGDGCGLNCDSMQIAEITYYYDANSTTTSTASSNTIVDPVTAANNTLCCGGSAASFNANPTNSAKVQAFVNRTTADSQVNIEQIGTQNEVTVSQSGTKNNYVNYYGNGLSNDVNIVQQGNATTQVNYTDLRVVGNFNSVTLQQTSTGGGKGIFADVGGNNNSLIVQQKDSGSHYAEITLSGGNKNVDVLQQGSASHMAKINLSGTPTDLSLTQSGSTQNYYAITHNCTTAGGCAKITVTQGQ
jgi:hypothetical protein